jgi:polyisoprenoid-binding protein YceI
MKKIFTIGLLVVATSLLAFKPATEKNNVKAGTWAVDAVHSNVKFTVTHLVISEVDGAFKVFDGQMNSVNEDFTDAQINFSIDVASINTDNEMRDNHLRSDDFFNADKFNKMSFESTSFKKVSGNKYELKGNLTIRNVTKPIVFDVTYGGTVKDPYGNLKAGFKAKSSINRFDYGLKWNSMTEAGGAVVGKEVQILCNIQMVKKG